VTLPLRDAVAVVTGAASGIGHATALVLAGRGCHLALVDRNAEGLEATAAEARGRGVRVTTYHLDVTDAAAVAALPGQVLADHGKVTVLVNNAGVGLVGRFEELTLEEFRWLVEINFLAVVALTKAFLPLLARQERAQIANLSSLYGIVAPAEQTAYVAAKFAVRGFSESLRHELEGTSVGVTVIHPGGVRTNIATGSRIAAAADSQSARAARQAWHDAMLTKPPEQAAAAIVRAIERRQPRLLIGADAHAAVFLQWLMPVRYWQVMKLAYARFRRITAAPDR
jgi:short-subunit dehydrogenase